MTCIPGSTCVWCDPYLCDFFTDEVNTAYIKVLVASARQIQTSVIEEERRALDTHLASAEVSAESQHSVHLIKGGGGGGVSRSADTEVCVVKNNLSVLQ